MSSNKKMRVMTGLATSRGFAVGPVFICRGNGKVNIAEYSIEPDRVEDEVLRFRRAINEAKRDVEGIISTLKERSSRDDAMVFECHIMLLEDIELISQIEDRIRKGLVNAESAVRSAYAEARGKFEQMNDSYFRERVRDLDDLERRLLSVLSGFGENMASALKIPSIIVADDLTPSETVQLPRDLVLGFATNGGSPTSHVALLARAMGIPAVTGLGDITSSVRAGERVAIDGANGTVTICPDARTIREYADLYEREREISEAAADGSPVCTLKDGGEILIFANVHPGVPISRLREHGARGVGLYRSEYLWLNREHEPSEEEQFRAYRDAARFTNTLGENASITIRVLDIGGDKIVRGITRKEENPFLGDRSIRYLLHNKAVFKTQLRAILRASAFGKVQLMYPMISCVEELKKAQEILDEVKKELEANSVPYDHEIPVGAMIEVPSAAINAGAIAKYVDFFSIGTNDLVQYVMAADRGNESVASLYQPTNPAVLFLMRNVIASAKRRGIKVSVCGESASDPVVGVLWAAMGIDVLSMSATYIPVISAILSRLTRAELDEYGLLDETFNGDLTADEVYQACRAWLKAHVFDFENIVL
ncbi:MAG: phosphoenolpyruvate--protein phosphotransferase [Kiritimatiellae bacterium]|nr:phosphoenolpyruvate--protein phosphotransferase [Kiritimatiellia bacterium]